MGEIKEPGAMSHVGNAIFREELKMLIFAANHFALTLSPEPQSSKRRPSFLAPIISISLVLFMLGLFGMVILFGQKITENYREKIQIQVLLHDGSGDSAVAEARKFLAGKSYIKEAAYISPEMAARLLTQDLGQDFQTILGNNPLPPSFDLFLYAGYANNDSLTWINRELKAHALVQDVVYPQVLLDEMSRNFRRVGLVLLGLCLIFFIIAITLINNTIRLTLYSKRFLIKSMQLVGATWGFITRPFLWQSVRNGLLGTILAWILLSAVIFGLQQQLPDLRVLLDPILLGIIYGGVLISGVIITFVSSYFSVRRYLKMRLDDLY